MRKQFTYTRKLPNLFMILIIFMMLFISVYTNAQIGNAECNAA